jgi:hypothetical protein
MERTRGGREALINGWRRPRSTSPPLLLLNEARRGHARAGPEALLRASERPLTGLPRGDRLRRRRLSGVKGSARLPACCRRRLLVPPLPSRPAPSSSYFRNANPRSCHL